MLLIKIKQQDLLRDGENVSDSVAYFKVTGDSFIIHKLEYY